MTNCITVANVTSQYAVMRTTLRRKSRETPFKYTEGHLIVLHIFSLTTTVKTNKLNYESVEKHMAILSEPQIANDTIIIKKSDQITNLGLYY
jgi:hypothetical protein